MRDERILTTTETQSLWKKKAENQQKQMLVQPTVQSMDVSGYMFRLQRQYGNRFVQRVVNLYCQGESEVSVGPEVERSVQATRRGRVLANSVRAQKEEEGKPRRAKLQDSQVQRQVKEEKKEEEKPVQMKQNDQIRVTQHRNVGNGINRWGGAEHNNITTKAAKGILEDPLFVYQVANASSRMDYKAKRIFWTGPLFLLSKIIPGLPEGEGPEHGEGYNYKNSDEGASAQKNINVQNAYLQQAVNYYRQAESLRKEGKPIRKVGSAFGKMFDALGDTCHIAQDRGAHWEGVKGRGHTDPRTKKGWDPDDPSDNAQGYQNALKNTKQLFTDWKSLTAETQDKGS